MSLCDSPYTSFLSFDAYNKSSDFYSHKPSTKLAKTAPEMIDPLSPSTISPPPSPSSNFPKSNNIAMLYYGVVVVGTGAILLTLYNLIIIKRRRDMQLRAAAGRNRRVDQFVATSRIYENSSCNLLLSSFKYNKKEEEGEGVDNECAVCLSVFEEGEEVRKLPRCNHSFHALCIDMWLYSHESCPICRTAVGPLCRQLPAENGNAPAENSREGLLVSGMSV